MFSFPLYAHMALLPLSLLLAVLLLIRLYLRRVVAFKSDDRLEGKTVVITGGNSGIGHAISVDLAKRGARVILACRDRTRRDSAPFSVRSRSGNVNVRFMYLDLSSLDSVIEFAHQFVETESRLDILINNAAVLTSKDWTADGLDMMIGVNYLGHFLLSNLLLDKMRNTGESPKILNIVCESYSVGSLDLNSTDLLPFGESDYSMYHAYAASKLALLIVTKDMAVRFKKHGICVFAVNPGNVDTKILRNWPGKTGELYRLISKVVNVNPEDGAHTAICCAVSKALDRDSGKCFKDCQAMDLGLFRQYDEEFRDKLWEKTETIIKSKGFELELKDD